MTNPDNDLRALIAQTSSDTTKPPDPRNRAPSAPRTSPQHTPTDAANDLQALITQASTGGDSNGERNNKGNIDTVQLSAQRSTPANAAEVKGALAQALYHAHTSAALADQSATRANSAAWRGQPGTSAPLALGQAVQQTQASPDASSATSRAAKPAQSLQLLLITGVLALLAVGGYAWWSHSRLIGPAATLHNLAQSVEQYRRQHSGGLPEKLSTLESFPKDAVEWQIRHWRARDAAGRTEIILLPNGPRRYRLVLRQGSEVWIYNDHDGQPRQTNK